MPISGRVDLVSQLVTGMDLAIISTMLKWAIRIVPKITISPFKRYPKTAVFRERNREVTTTASMSEKSDARKLLLLNIKVPWLTLSGVRKG